jgi:hypothetical protein
MGLIRDVAGGAGDIGGKLRDVFAGNRGSSSDTATEPPAEPGATPA